MLDHGGIDSFCSLPFVLLGDADELVLRCIIFVDDGNAFKQEPLGVVFVEIVFIFFPVIVVFAHKAVVALVWMPSI